MADGPRLVIRDGVQVVPKARLADVQGNAAAREDDDVVRSPGYLRGVLDAYRLALGHAAECRAEADNPGSRAASDIARKIFKLSEPAR